MEQGKENIRREAERLQEIQSLLERELEGVDLRLEELMERITVFQDGFLVEVAGLPVGFRVCAETKRDGRRCQVEITEWRPVPLGETR